MLFSCLTPRQMCCTSLQKAWFMASSLAHCQQAKDFRWLHSISHWPLGLKTHCKRPILCWICQGSPVLWEPGGPHWLLPAENLALHAISSMDVARWWLNDSFWVFTDKKYVRLFGKSYLLYCCQVFPSLLLPSFDFKWNFLITSQILYHANLELVNIVQNKIAEK